MRILIILLFILFLAVFTFLSKFFYKDRIEADIAGKVQNLLNEENVGGVSVAVDEHWVGLSGNVSNGAVAEKAADITDSVWGAYVPDETGLVSQPLDPANLYVSRDADQVVTLRGVVPDQTTKDGLLAAAGEIPNVSRVNDELQIGSRIAPPAWGADVTNFLPSLYNRSADATLTADHRSVVVTGTVDDEEAKSELAGQVNGLARGEAAFEDKIVVAQWVDPEYKISGDGDGLVVTGLLPDEASRAALLASVSRGANGRPIDDQTTLGNRVRQPWWGDHSAGFVPHLFTASPQDAFAHYTADGLVARGTVANDGMKTELEGIANRVPGDQNITTELALVPPPSLAPARLVATHYPDRITLTGTVAAAEESQAIEEGAKVAFPNLAVTNEINVVDGIAPATWAGGAGNLMGPHFESVRQGVLTIENNGVKLEGITDTDQLKSGVEAVAREQIGSELSYNNLIAVNVPPPADALVAELKLLPVYFGSDSSEIQEKEVSKIEKAAKVIQGSGANSVGLTVGGYADLRGSAEYNKKLSLRRAGAVRDRLIALGVSSDLLTVNHFGEDTSEVDPGDLWKSRRVEISLTPVE